MTLHALSAIGDAITATREYRPRGAGEWLWAVFVVLLVGTPGIGLSTGGGGTGTGTGTGTGGPDTGTGTDAGTGTGGGGEGLSPETVETIRSIEQTIVELLPVIVAVLAAVWVLFVVLGALLEFPFLAWLRDGEVDTGAEIRAHLGQGLGLAAFRILLGAVGFGLAAAFVLAIVGTDAGPMDYLLAAGQLSVVFGLVSLPVGVVTAFTTGFVVPTMLLEDTGVVGGWRRFWSTLTGAPKQFLAYAVAVAVLAYIGGILAVIVAALATIPASIVGGIIGIIVAVAADPIVGIVVAAAVAGVVFTAVALAAYALVEIFLRYYALFVLASVDEDLDYARRRRRAVTDGDDDEAQDTGGAPDLANGTDDPQFGAR